MKGIKKVKHKKIAILLLFLCSLMTLTGCFEGKKETKQKVFTFTKYSKSEGLTCEQITSLSRKERYRQVKSCVKTFSAKRETFFECILL